MNTNTVSKDSVLMSTILIVALTMVGVLATSNQIEASSAATVAASTTAQNRAA